MWAYAIFDTTLHSFIYGYQYYVHREFVDSVKGFVIELGNLLFYGISTGFVYHNRFWVFLVDKSCRFTIEQNVAGLMLFTIYGSKTFVSMFLMEILN